MPNFGQEEKRLARSLERLNYDPKELKHLATLQRAARAAGKRRLCKKRLAAAQRPVEDSSNGSKPRRQRKEREKTLGDSLPRQQRARQEVGRKSLRFSSFLSTLSAHSLRFSPLSPDFQAPTRFSPLSQRWHFLFEQNHALCCLVTNQITLGQLPLDARQDGQSRKQRNGAQEDDGTQSGAI